MWSVRRGRTEGLNFFGGGDIQQKRKVQTFGLAGGAHPFQIPHLVVNPDLPIRKLLRVLGLLTVMFLKRFSETIFFQSNKLTAYKVERDGKEVASFFMVFNLLKTTQACKEDLVNHILQLTRIFD